jgi:hypothetical protein
VGRGFFAAAAFATRRYSDQASVSPETSLRKAPRESKFSREIKFEQMISEAQKRRIRLYSPSERSRLKAEHRRADAAEVACGRAEEVQERNRALPHASEFAFSEREEALPME